MLSIHHTRSDKLRQLSRIFRNERQGASWASTKKQTTTQAHIHPYGQFRITNQPYPTKCSSLDCGRKLKCPERTSTDKNMQMVASNPESSYCETRVPHSILLNSVITLHYLCSKGFPGICMPQMGRGGKCNMPFNSCTVKEVIYF